MRHVVADRLGVADQIGAADVFGGDNLGYGAERDISVPPDPALEREGVVIDDQRHARHRLREIGVETHDLLLIERQPHRPTDEQTIRACRDERAPASNRFPGVQRADACKYRHAPADRRGHPPR